MATNNTSPSSTAASTDTSSSTVKTVTPHDGVYVVHSGDQSILIKDYDPSVDHLVFDHIQVNGHWLNSQHALAMLVGTHQMGLETFHAPDAPAGSDMWITEFILDHGRTVSVEHPGQQLDLLHDVTYVAPHAVNG